MNLNRTSRRVTRRQLLRMGATVGVSLAGLTQLLACSPSVPSASAPTPVSQAPTTVPAAAPTQAPAAPTGTTRALAAAPAATQPAAGSTPAAAQTAGAPKRGGTLRAAFSALPTVIDPHKAAGQHEWSITQAMFNNLIRTNQKLEPVPELAESWDGSPDSKTWTFKLRKGVKFHHGREMDADDVVASFGRIADPQTASPARSTFGLLDQVEKVDPLTVRFHLNTAYVDFPTRLGSHWARIVPRDKLDTLSSMPIGTGPFKYKEFRAGDQMILERFDGYWEQGADGQPLPYMQELQIIGVAEMSSQISGLTSGSLDFLNELTPEVLGPLTNNPQFQVVEIPSPAFHEVNMRVDLDPYKEVKVRQALKYLIDRQGLLSAVLQGHGVAAADSPIPPGSPYYSPIDPLPYDVEKAKSLLADAGHPDGIDVELVDVGGIAGLEQFAELFDQMAQAAGVRVTLRKEPFDVFMGKDFTKAALTTGQWNGRAQVDELLGLVYQSDGAWNESHWQNQQLDALLVKARSEPSVEARKAIYTQIATLFRDEGPIVAPYFLNYITAGRANMKGFEPHPIRWSDFRSAWLA